MKRSASSIERRLVFSDSEGAPMDSEGVDVHENDAEGNSLLADVVASARAGSAGVWAAVTGAETYERHGKRVEVKTNCNLRWLSYMFCFMCRISSCFLWFVVLLFVMIFAQAIMTEHNRSRELDIYMQRNERNLKRSNVEGEVAEYTSDYVKLDEAVDGMWYDYNTAKVYYANALKSEADAKLQMDTFVVSVAKAEDHVRRLKESLKESIEKWELARKNHTRWKIVVDHYEDMMRYGNEQLRQRHPLWDINDEE